MPNHTLKFPMVGGDSKFVLIRTHVHKFPHTHTQLVSRNGKEIENTHNTRQMGVGIKEKEKTTLGNFSADVDSLATPLGT